LARAKWVALETKDALSTDELTLLLRESYDMVVAKLPRKTRETLATVRPAARINSRKNHQTKRKFRKSRQKTKKPSRCREGS
jgi:hypothetical protein